MVLLLLHPPADSLMVVVVVAGHWMFVKDVLPHPSQDQSQGCPVPGPVE